MAASGSKRLKRCRTLAIWYLLSDTAIAATLWRDKPMHGIRNHSVAFSSLEVWNFWFYWQGSCKQIHLVVCSLWIKLTAQSYWVALLAEQVFCQHFLPCSRCKQQLCHLLTQRLKQPACATAKSTFFCRQNLKWYLRPRQHIMLCMCLLFVSPSSCSCPGRKAGVLFEGNYVRRRTWIENVIMINGDMSAPSTYSTYGIM